MTHGRELLIKLNKSNIFKVRIENEKEIVVKDAITITIKTHGIKLIFDISYVSSNYSKNFNCCSTLKKWFNLIKGL